MKTVINYFTGSGNSLAAAKRIAALLGGSDLVPIASLKDTPGRIAPAADRVGIVCPVYDAGVPRIVAEFTRRLDLSKASYVFAVVTMGGTGVSALHQINGILREGGGRNLDAGFAVTMPANFPPLSRPPAMEKTRTILAAADIRLAGIAQAIRQGKSVPPGLSPLSSLMRHLLYPPFFENVHGMDASFSVDDSCTACGTCATVCPVGNITIANDRPVWQHRCELCCACLHFCPAEAIQLDMMLGTKGRGRYRHPDVNVADMKAQRGETPENPATGR
ncbi:MAG TPA: EFR1 family ferrodoxin [Methanoregulaceae archaeon]|nr:EFR1 family ferrodoxin [Methanoregulaceae archaeon]HRY75839.1 EFR1 family ferrodoxin [Methanoregulaceae archaeon]